MPRKLRKLVRLRIDEVSAVDRGAGEGVKVVLMKRDAGDEMVERGREILRRHGIDFHNDDGNNPMTNITEWRDYLENWIASLSPQERAWARRQIDLADDAMAEQERANAVRGSTPRRAVAPGRQNELTAGQRDGYGSGAKAKSDSLQKIASDFGIQRLASHLIQEPGGVAEHEFVELVNKHAEKTGAKVWSGDTEESRLICKAASVLRQDAYAKQADAHMAQARKRRLG
jgi:hypothetical protein